MKFGGPLAKNTQCGVQRAGSERLGNWIQVPTVTATSSLTEVVQNAVGGRELSAHFVTSASVLHQKVHATQLHHMCVAPHTLAGFNTEYNPGASRP